MTLIQTRGISADFTGCEIRVAAGLSGDRQFLEAELSPWCYKCERNATLEDPCACGLKNDGTEVAGHTGLHWLAAHLTFGEGATKENRYQAKAVIFRKLFGGAPDSPVAEQIANVFDRQIAPEYARWDAWLRKCWYDGSLISRDYNQPLQPVDQDYYQFLYRSSGALEAESYYQACRGNYREEIPGSSRYAIYQTYSGRKIYATKGAHAVGNYAIQGTAREMLADAIIRWSQGRWGNCVILPIHDELLAFVPEHEAELAVKFLVECMRSDVMSTPDWQVHVDADPDEPWNSWPDAA